MGEYNKQAEEAMAREEVPPGYKGAVREYFRSLQAGEGRAAGPAGSEE